MLTKRIVYDTVTCYFNTPANANIVACLIRSSSPAIPSALICFYTLNTSAMTNVLRVPKLDLPSILAQQNPQIDLRLEAYENSTRNFLAAVSNYTQRAMTEITKRKDAFNAEKKKIAERTQHVQTETNQCKVREIELISGALLVTACRHEHHVLTSTSV